jgi:TolB protein
MGRRFASIAAAFLQIVSGAACSDEPPSLPSCEPQVGRLDRVAFRPDVPLVERRAPASGRLAFHSDRQGRHKIFYVDLGSARVMAATTGSDHHDEWPAWSHDGRALAFATTRFDHATFEVAVMDVAGGDARRVTASPPFDLHPAWLPDGRSLLYTTDVDGTQAVFRVAVDGADASRAIPGPDRALTPHAAADGRIAWVAGTPCALRVFVAKGPGDRGEPVSPDVLDAATPRWSPDGTRLAYVLLHERTSWLAVHTLASGAIEHIRLADGRQLREPAWSPDGRWIAAASAAADGRDWDLVVLRADGPDAAHRVTDGAASDRAPAWSPR